MHFDEVMNNGKPKAEAGEFASAGAARLPKRFKDMGQKLRANAPACIFNLNQSIGFDGFQNHVDFSTAWRELDRVAEQIPDDLLDAVWITVDCRFRLELC